jgi:3-oxoacyl-(acyl-carrier-protein) synthase III
VTAPGSPGHPLCGGIAVWSAHAVVGPRRVGNDEVAALCGVDAAWIVERTGILERWWDGDPVEMALAAARGALDEAGVSPAELALVVVATSTARRQVPAVAAEVASALGSAAGSFDVNAACAGAVYGLMAAGPVAAAGARVLVIGTDAYSSVLDLGDRDTNILFGDGAGAVVLGPGDGALLSSDMASVPETTDHAAIPLGGTLTMRGRDVYRIAVTEVPKSIERALAAAGVRTDEVRAVVAHQANRRILDAIAERLGLAADAVPVTIEHTGNTSAATVPATLAACQGDFAPGDVVVLCGFGGGMTIATSVFRWGTRTAHPLHLR